MYLCIAVSNQLLILHRYPVLTARQPSGVTDHLSRDIPPRILATSHAHLIRRQGGIQGQRHILSNLQCRRQPCQALPVGTNHSQHLIRHLVTILHTLHREDQPVTLLDPVMPPILRYECMGMDYECMGMDYERTGMGNERLISL